jgi:hypothetical protein
MAWRPLFGAFGKPQERPRAFRNRCADKDMEAAADFPEADALCRQGTEYTHNFLAENFLPDKTLKAPPIPQKGSTTPWITLSKIWYSEHHVLEQHRSRKTVVLPQP